MDDLELINLAAKAAGVEYTHNSNPLNDDALALRLAVKLGIGIAHPEKIDTVWVCKSDCCDIYVQYDDDSYAATRRAIVMAAAEIGRGM